MRDGIVLRGVFAPWLGGIHVRGAVTFAAGNPKSVPAPIAPRGRGQGEYDTGY